MQFIGSETDAGDDMHVFATIKTLASRVRNMKISEREDLYSAMRTLVKLADSPVDEQDVLLNTLSNSPTSRQANTQRSNSLVLGDEMDEGVENLIDEFQAQEDKLSATLPDSKKKGIWFVDGDVSHDCAGSDEQRANVEVSSSPKRTDSFARYGNSGRAQVSDWRKDRDSVDRKRRYCRLYKALAGFFGVHVLCSFFLKS